MCESRLVFGYMTEECGRWQKACGQISFHIGGLLSTLETCGPRLYITVYLVELGIIDQQIDSAERIKLRLIPI